MLRCFRSCQLCASATADVGEVTPDAHQQSCCAVSTGSAPWEEACGYLPEQQTLSRSHSAYVVTSEQPDAISSSLTEESILPIKNFTVQTLEPNKISAKNTHQSHSLLSPREVEGIVQVRTFLNQLQHQMEPENTIIASTDPLLLFLGSGVAATVWPKKPTFQSEGCHIQPNLPTCLFRLYLQRVQVRYQKKNVSQKCLELQIFGLANIYVPSKYTKI